MGARCENGGAGRGGASRCTSIRPDRCRQKLYFSHPAAGDLTPLLAGYFDTTTGPKHEAASYRRIAETIGRPASDLLFLSDVAAELIAARAAGFQAAVQVRREPPLAGRFEPSTASFDDLKRILRSGIADFARNPLKYRRFSRPARPSCAALPAAGS